MRKQIWIAFLIIFSFSVLNSAKFDICFVDFDDTLFPTSLVEKALGEIAKKNKVKNESKEEMKDRVEKHSINGLTEGHVSINEVLTENALSKIDKSVLMLLANLKLSCTNVKPGFKS